MNTIESYFLTLGMSWTLSKAIPYMTCVLLGLLFIVLTRKWKTQMIWVSITVKSLLFITPFTLYFAVYPIYVGDFSNNGVKTITNLEFPESKSITVIVLPNCPYCYQSLSLMMKLKKRNPTISISYWVATSDTIPEKTAILRVMPKEFKAIQQHETKAISELTKGTFPCFVISNNKKAVKIWNNNQFGVRALDEIESFFK